MSGPDDHLAEISDPASSSTPQLEQSGTLNQLPEHISDATNHTAEETGAHTTEAQRNEGEEQALEWHEVIELQAFSDRKVWIEEKIKLLEKMPPIEVFTGLDAVRNSSIEVPGLPSRAELEEWMAEHDRIEKETEIFDSGELKKLKKLTKAAAQRNLSPADTDLIELTLTTIYALDKLLHLLRDRSEQLDLLAVRLTWEERRIAAWIELRNTHNDITDFLNTRARWSPAVYDDLEAVNRDDEVPTPPLGPSARRNSVVSIASIASDTSNASMSLSRGARFKLSEQLSRDAAQIASRVSSLRHTKINAAGKALDRLIDDSRKPVPEILLDEQDKLEDKGINEMEDVGKFVMSVVMQWKKADEVYAETVKDKATALELVDELETALYIHPNSRQDTAYLSRTNALTKRLVMRGNPAASSSSFPRPSHPLFPDQPKTTESIVQRLSSEFITAVEHTKKAETLARQYHAGLDAVRKVEAICKQASERHDQLASCLYRLQHGVGHDHGDGTPPDLSTEAALSPARHAAFLALLPTLMQETHQAEATAEALLQSANVAFADLERPGIDPQFIIQSKAVVDGLRAVYHEVQRAKEPVLTRTATLRDLRKVWAAMEVTFRNLNQLRYETSEAIQRDMWKQQSSSHSPPPTPDGSPASVPVPFASATDLPARFSALSVQFHQDTSSFLKKRADHLGPILLEYVVEGKDGLSRLLSTTRSFLSLLDSIRNQAAAMRTIQSEASDLHSRLEVLELQFEGSADDILQGKLSGEQLSTIEAELATASEQLKARVQSFSDSLMHRIPFVSDGQVSNPHPQLLVTQSSTALEFTPGIVRQTISARLPVDPAAIDCSVRTDANALSLSLSGAVETLAHKAERFRLSQVSRGLDLAVVSLLNSLQHIEETMTSIGAILEDNDNPVSVDSLKELSTRVGELADTQLSPLSVSFSPIRDRLRELAREPSTSHLPMLGPRQKAVEGAEQRYLTCINILDSLTKRIVDVQTAEEARLAEQTRQKEAARLAAEAAAAEQRRLEEEARRVAELCRLEEVARLAAAEAEQRRLEEEKAARLVSEAAVAKRGLLEEEEAARRSTELRRLEEEEVTRLTEERRREEGEMAHCLAEQRRLEEEAAMRFAEAEQWRREEEEDAQRRLEQCRLQEEEARRLEEEARFVAERAAASRRIQEQAAELAAEEEHRHVFSVRSDAGPSSEGSAEVKTAIFKLRKRLRSIGLNELARPSAHSTHSLPTFARHAQAEKQLAWVVKEANTLPASLPHDDVVDAELRSLRSEIEASQDSLRRVDQLTSFAESVEGADNALSDLLEHIDSYPSVPSGPLAAPHTSDLRQAPEEQLKARLIFTEGLIHTLKNESLPVADDPRAQAEHERIVQTWSELHAMATDMSQGKKSRPASVVSSTRSGSSRPASVASIQKTHKKAAGYANLSVGSTSQFLSPPIPHNRRAVSGGTPKLPRSGPSHPRSSSRASLSSSRSVSGPGTVDTPSKLYNTTFASRQRTSSISSTTSGTPVKVEQRATPSTSRVRAQTAQSQSRTASPAFSDASSIYASSMHSRSSMNLSRTSMRSSWARAPRQSFPSLPRSPPRVRPAVVRKPYVANPKNKLDVAVGDVVNKLPVNMDINVEVVADTWKDQSGKYWIGSQDPKLCFCRILRSQTVMVRVGGGWSELSKQVIHLLLFIKNHFADAFRLLPESPPRFGAREEKWINSTSLSQVAAEIPEPPRTPEPKNPYMPSFALSTPSGTSPRSIKSSSPGSPLTALQFIRRADRESPLLRPETPTRSSRPGPVAPPSVSRAPVWRP
ncbi:hypothetical protein BXZ70DRAFT_886776 [Cristinia sonorae]|uniref:GAR domain-containing protein n=1 Tax=Cristinia sonorae TaxID=1940300 RepID=A0A8K0UWC9_9AGAR|nr:hypothetical protein BXZ70DRAFT_886776 [Cristinia sonorae]